MRHRELRVVTGAENDFLTCALTITEPPKSVRSVIVYPVAPEFGVTSALVAAVRSSSGVSLIAQKIHGFYKVAIRHIKVPKDRQTFTGRFTGPNAQGKRVTQNDVWQKQ
jgi:hypothetical protein